MSFVPFMSFLFRLLNLYPSMMPTARAASGMSRSRATSRARRVLPLAVITAAVASACQFDTITVPDGRERPVVHAVLNPWTADQTILLERTLTGRVTIDDDLPPNRVDPIVSGGGVPISGARVVIYNAGNDSVVAVEDVTVRDDGRGAGVYRFRNSAIGPNGDPR